MEYGERRLRGLAACNSSGGVHENQGPGTIAGRIFMWIDNGEGIYFFKVVKRREGLAEF